jgi:cytochrome P450
MLSHSWIFGHLIPLGKMMAKYPRDTYGHMLAQIAKEEYPALAAEGLIYFDVWPVTAPQVFVFHPEMMTQFTQVDSQPKVPALPAFTHALTEGRDLVSLDGPLWKRWRSIFNPGFAAQNVLRFVPAMVEEAEVFKAHLRAAARKGDVISLIEATTLVTIDVIGRATMGVRFNVQKQPNALIDTLRETIYLMIYENVSLKYLDLTRPYKIWRNRRRMRAALTPYVMQAIAEVKSDRVEGPKTILNLAVQSYVAEVGGDKGLSRDTTRGSKSDQVDPQFLDMVLSQLKVFLFAGHDTTASALCFAYYLLSSYPETLTKLRQEHDLVLGSDASQAGTLIAADPTLLNKLPYTSAVLKETLRLYPPITTTRQGSASYFLVHPDTKKVYPTDGFAILGASHASHRQEAYFPRPHEFLPERFLARDASDPLYVRKNSWRPFELGPRNCVGQELANVEMKLILAMTAREFDIKPAYAKDAPKILGEQGYQALASMSPVAHPSDGMPVRISAREQA